MCRKNHMHGMCVLCFGLGLMVGHSMESWFLCLTGGVGLMIFGLLVTKQH